MIHLLSYPGQFSDTGVQFYADVLELCNLSDAPHIIGITESSERHQELLKVHRKTGYRVIQPYEIDRPHRFTGTVLLARPDVRVMRYGFIEVIKANPIAPAQGGHDARGITFGVFLINGKRVWVGEFHRLTGWKDSRNRALANMSLDEELMERSKRNSEGDRVAFAMGDPNMANEDYDNRMRGMTSVWTELGQRPPFGTNTILSRNNDIRVECDRVLIRDRLGVHSDHDPVSAWFKGV